MSENAEITKQFNKSEIFNDEFYFRISINYDFLAYIFAFEKNAVSSIFCFVLSCHDFSVFSYRRKFATLALGNRLHIINCF